MTSISIIIPHKNIPNLLKRCLDSIPDIEDFQVIVVDDNSSEDIVDFNSFPGKDRKYTEVYFTKAAKGAGYARNVGLEHVRGKWTMFADADDYFTSDFAITIMMNLMEEYDLTCFPVMTVDEYGKRLDNSEIDTIINSDKYSDKEKALAIVTPFAKIIRTSYIQENKICFHEIKYGNDILFSLNAALHTDNISICHSPIFYVYVVRQQSLSNTVTMEALRKRINTSIHHYRYLKKCGYADCMRQVNSVYLAYASQLGKWAFLYTTFRLLVSGLLFYRAKYKDSPMMVYLYSHIKYYINFSHTKK